MDVVPVFPVAGIAVRRDAGVDHPGELHELKAGMVGGDPVVDPHHLRCQFAQLLADRAELAGQIHDRPLDRGDLAPDTGVERFEGDFLGRH